MPRIFFAFTIALALAAVNANTAAAQIVVYNGNVPSPPGVYVVNTPPFYNGLLFSNGVITAFPAPPPAFGYYSGYGYPYRRPVYPYNPHFAPGAWRPRTDVPAPIERAKE